MFHTWKHRGGGGECPPSAPFNLLLPIDGGQDRQGSLPFPWDTFSWVDKDKQDMILNTKRPNAES